MKNAYYDNYNNNYSTYAAYNNVIYNTIAYATETADTGAGDERMRT